ncbi:ribonuclease H [Patescibacteria group bacterium]
MKKIVIYTDGSCLGNPGPGGYGVLIQPNGEEVILKGGEASTTNNRMEMTAVLEALKWIVQNLTKGDLAEIYSDSSLVVKSMTQGWKRKANLDIWAEIDKAMIALEGISINWHWVKGHSDDHFNERVDQIAVEESKKIEKDSEHIALPKELADGYYCQKCNEKVAGRLSYNSEADMIRVDCEKCGSYIMFAEKTKENLNKAKKRILASKAQLEKIKMIKEDQGETIGEKEMKKLKTLTREQADELINSAQTLWD